ncbi:MAG TPA: hypothetical protein VE978_19525 [Chitinophagales bacterium]|nr:hypothetical protein [Chitinophagales bacterium]
MKSKAPTLICLLLFLSFHQYSFAQQKGVDDLVEQYRSLLHPPPDQAKNTLAYTQNYMDLKKKVAALGETSKAAFENGIAKFAEDTGYATLHTLLFTEVAAQSAMDSIENKVAAKGTDANATAPKAADSTVQMQVFDRKHKLLQTTQIKPADLENKMKKDGFQIAIASYDFNSHTVTLTLSRTDASGTTARITLPSTGDLDAKYKLVDGRSLTLHSTNTGASTVKVSAGKVSSQHTQKKN